jgi:uncharacterized membrane protein YfcA
VVAKIGIPGAVGAFAGATFLSSLSTETAAPLMSIILLVLGGYILVRFTTFGLPKGQLGKPLRKRFLAPLGVVAGFVDSTGGGGWGPVGTPAILASGRLEPRKTIGSIDTSEFLVAVAASVGFIIGIGSEGVNYAWVAALLIGGIIAAPVAAWLVRHIPPRVLGSAVGGLIVLTNTRTLLRSDWIGAPDGVRYTAYALIYAVWAAALAYSIRQYRANSEEERRIIAEAEAAAHAGDTPDERITAPVA